VQVRSQGVEPYTKYGAIVSFLPIPGSNEFKFSFNIPAKKCKSRTLSAGSKLVTIIRIFTIHSPHSYLSRSMDLLYDKVIWSWTGEYTDELEASLASLVISIEDDLKEVSEKWAPITQAVGISDFSRLIDVATENLALAMGEHSALGIGRIHSEFYQFLVMGGMMQVMMPQSLVDCIKAFEAVKWKLSEQREIIRLARCVQEGYC